MYQYDKPLHMTPRHSQDFHPEYTKIIFLKIDKMLKDLYKNTIYFNNHNIDLNRL
jgi:hypothetical protein